MWSFKKIIVTLLICILGWELPTGSGAVEAVTGSILSIQEKKTINTEGGKRKGEPIFYLQEKKTCCQRKQLEPHCKINSSF